MTTMDIRTAYTDFARQATGDPSHEPYEYQHRIAAEGLPELLAVPTGCGKTAAVALGWLFRRRAHPDEVVRAGTPHWLVYVLPQRVLVEQTHAEVTRWLGNVAPEMRCHVVMGGQRERTWRHDLDRDAVLVGTQDMLLSRALNRGYGDGRGIWPIDFGLLHSGCHWVMDEVQLMGPGLPTTRQLHGLRDVLGTSTACGSTWMSATVDESKLRTVDCPTVATRVELGASDRQGALARRLDAPKTVGEVVVSAKRYARDLAHEAIAVHRPGRRTLVVLNTVDRARQVWEAISTSSDVPTVLIHSRFRPADRASHIAAALASPGEHGMIVVSTQVLEAGVDMSADVLVTEAAPWPSIVQRAGRCNRDGSADEAALLWVDPPKSAPYPDADIAASVALLRSLEGGVTTPDQMGAQEVPITPVTHAVLRRRDLIELFDTLPDLSGNDVDVTRFVRDNEDRSLEVAWRILGETTPTTRSLPAREERCPAPIAEVRDWVKERDRVWRFDHLDDKWVRCRRDDVRPGMALLADVETGGYTADVGWCPSWRGPVMPVDLPSRIQDGNDLDPDGGSVKRRRWVSLAEHSADTAAEADRLIGALDPPSVTMPMREATIRAAFLHDIGKTHDVFVESMDKLIGDDSVEAYGVGPPWAKSASKGRLRHSRHHFRHELVSALILLGDGAGALEGCTERDLAVYLVAAHHGRARLALRSLPGESEPPPERPGAAVVLGVADGDRVDAIELGTVGIPQSRLDLTPVQLGNAADGNPSWAQRMLSLRDRADLGPFRLGFLEAVVRMADWKASEASDVKAAR